MKQTTKGVKKHKKTNNHLEHDIVERINNLKSKRSGTDQNKVDTKKKKKHVPPNKPPDKDNKAKKSYPNSQETAKESSTDKTNPEPPPATLCLKDVMDLGGTEADFNLMKEVSDNEEDLEVDCNSNTQFDFAELINFMKSNGLKTVKKPKAKKAATSESSDKLIEESPKIASLVIPDNPSPHTQLLFKANEPWYTNLSSSKGSNSVTDVQKWMNYAEQLWKNEVKLSVELRDKYQSSDQQWMKTVFSGGTTNDKVSANCLLLQESPVHHITSLEALLAMAKKKSKRLAIQAIDSLKDMFLSAILPDDKKLLNFSQHNFGALEGKEIDVNLIGWLVEDRLKAHYADFIEIVKIHLSDNEVPIRTKLCNIVYQLLNEKPEKEQELLSLLVNKIGDPDNKLASKIIYILSQLLQNHPYMKKVVAVEVERILFRSNISERAQYYSVCFLNQLQLSAEDTAFAGHLIEIYFKFFSESIENKNLDSRMLGGLLTGVNRSYPYTDKLDGITDDNINTLFKLVYVGNFNVSVQALMLLYQVSGNKSDICNRYFQALYSKLLDPSVNSSSKKTFLLNLIYKSLKRDDSVVRKVAIARRLLQISNLDDPVLACASLYTISEANKISVPESEAAIKPTAKISKPQSESSQGVNNDKSEDTISKEKDASEKGSYDSKTRNPLYSNADQESLWEFSLLCKNFHPSVNQFVSSLLTEGDVSYDGDPFNDFTRIKFLDKFVFKNPKKDVTASNKKFYSKNKLKSNVPQVYSSDFKDQKANKVHADEQFFYEYFNVKKSTRNVNEKVIEKDDSDVKTLDFVDDIKDSVIAKPKKKKKKLSGSDSEEESDSGSEFSYDGIDDQDDDPENITENTYEKFLWENLDSDGESLKGSDGEEESVKGSDDEVNETIGDDDDDDWEDLEVGDSDEKDSDGGDKQPKFLDADKLDSIILKSQSKKKKRKMTPHSKEVSDSSRNPKKQNKNGNKKRKTG